MVWSHAGLCPDAIAEVGSSLAASCVSGKQKVLSLISSLKHERRNGSPSGAGWEQLLALL